MDSLLEKQYTCIRSTGKAFVAPSLEHARSIHFAPPWMDYSRPPGASPIQNNSVSSPSIETPFHSVAGPTTFSARSSHTRERSILTVRCITTTDISPIEVDGLGKRSRSSTIENLCTARSYDLFHTTKQSMAREASRAHENNKIMVDIRRRAIMYIRSVVLIDFRSPGRQCKSVKLRPVHLAGQSMRQYLSEAIAHASKKLDVYIRGFY